MSMTVIMNLQMIVIEKNPKITVIMESKSIMLKTRVLKYFGSLNGGFEI